MFTKLFWKDAVERAVKTFAQALLALFTGGQTGVLDVDWGQSFSVAGLAAAVSVLTSIVSSQAGPDGGASLVVGATDVEG